MLGPHMHVKLGFPNESAHHDARMHICIYESVYTTLWLFVIVCARANLQRFSPDS